MLNFLNITKGELMKSFKGKSIIIMLSIVIGVTIMMSLIFGLTVDEYAKLYPPVEGMEEILPQDVIDGINIEIYDNDLAYANGTITKYKHDLIDYQHRSYKLVVEYIIDNDMSFGDFNIYQGEEMLRVATMQNLVLFSLSSAMMIVAIIASILAAGALNDEMANGTMRLLLICPVNRVKLIFAK